jgi:hypothetical protein
MIETTQLQPDKTVVFKSPIQGDSVLVRTGNDGSWLSFFQSVLHSCSKNYSCMSTEEKIKFVENFRNDIISKIDIKSWEEIDKGLTSKLLFIENMNDILFNCCLFLENNSKAKGKATYQVIKNLSGENEKSLEIYKLIVKMIPYKEGFKKKILPNAYTKSKNKNISDICEAIINETTTYIKNKKCLIDIQAIRKFLLTIFKEAEDQAFKTFVSNLQNSKKDVDENIVSLVSNHFKRDIYFLNYKNRMPYMHCQTTKKLKKQKSIILFCFGKGRYEIIGKLLNNNFIQREFDFDDIIIKKMYMFLVNPEKIQTNFKDLVQYLPQKGKKNSDSEEESGKDSGKDSEENSEEDSEEDSEEHSEEDSEEDSD